MAASVCSDDAETQTPLRVQRPAPQRVTRATSPRTEQVTLRTVSTTASSPVRRAPRSAVPQGRFVPVRRRLLPGEVRCSVCNGIRRPGRYLAIQAPQGGVPFRRLVPLQRQNMPVAEVDGRLQKSPAQGFIPSHQFLPQEIPKPVVQDFTPETGDENIFEEYRYTDSSDASFIQKTQPYINLKPWKRSGGDTPLLANTIAPSRKLLFSCFVRELDEMDRQEEVRFNNMIQKYIQHRNQFCPKSKSF